MFQYGHCKKIAFGRLMMQIIVYIMYSRDSIKNILPYIILYLKIVKSFC